MERRLERRDKKSNHHYHSNKSKKTKQPWTNVVLALSVDRVV